jgi:hypothetical protein
VAKMLDMARPDSAGFRRGTRDATSRRSDTPLAEMKEVASLKELSRYRERVDVEIGKGSERGARWWSRRLVQLYADAGLVRLDK